MLDGGPSLLNCGIEFVLHMPQSTTTQIQRLATGLPTVAPALEVQPPGDYPDATNCEDDDRIIEE